jgi:protein disulfide-isomerase
MAGPYEEGRDARADIAAAQALAAQEGKLVLLDFGANWCTDCIVLDELYHDPEVAALLAERYVLVTIDVGEFDRNLDVSAEYNDAAGVGIPSLVVLTADGTIIADTHAGEFASARDFVPSDVLQYLGQFNP